MEFQRESVFISAIRTFFRMFLGMLGILIAIFLFFLFHSAMAPSPLLSEKTTPEILPNAENKRELVSPAAPAILQIPIHGIIGDPNKLTAGMIENVLLDSRGGLLANNRVKGILLHFNTPGGTVVDSNEIYRMLQEYKARYQVPIFAYVEGLCASGGMYVASAADQIFAGPASIIGSVGVLLGPFLNFYDLMTKVGIQAKTLTEGIDKDMMNPTRPWVEGEDASFKAIMAFFYNRFVDIVTRARPHLDREKLIQEYGAQVYDCIKAQQLGYIDHPMSSREEALVALLQAANLDPEKPYQVISLKPKYDWISELVKGKSPLLSGKIDHTLDFGQLPFPDQVAYLYTPSG